MDAHARGMARSTFLRRASASSAPAARLLCIPHAGAGASSFNQWALLLPDWIELVKVQLPGREDRGSVELHHRLEPLVAALVPEVETLLDAPLVCYGHCVGALICFELIRELRLRGHPLPAALFVSGRISPQRRPDIYLSELEEDELVAGLQRMGAASPLLTNPRWRGYYLPTLRADNALSDNYVYRERPPLSCPIHLFLGRDDPCRDEEGWRRQTSAGFASHEVDGGHFFSKDGLTELVGILGRVTGGALGLSVPPPA